ncbi:MAG: universal stress protein [Flavobacteriia bacterium]|jgi:nucleotide-binding universal stress UspA family protein
MKYLVPFDFSEVSKNAVENAISLAKQSGGDITLIHVVSDRELVKRNKMLLDDYINHLNVDNSNIHLSENVFVGDPFEDIGKMADTNHANYVIMGTHGLTLSQKIFGGHTVKIISNSSTPFIVLQDDVKIKEINKIVLPYSIENKSLQVIKFASQLCKTYGAELHLIGRHHDDEFLKHKENNSIILAKKHLLEHGVKHHIELGNVSKGDFMNYILDYAKKENADLIAATYFSDALMPMFEKFIQNLIVNDLKIPVLCVNAQTLSKTDSSLSFMTS